jgi:uncharacterized protein YceH (UPF0502 family)
MTDEAKSLSVSEMLRTTADNHAKFIEQVAAHIEKLESAVAQLRSRITELESINGNNTKA